MMSLDIICKPDEFENFKDGMIGTILIEGKEKPWGMHTSIRLGSLINIYDKASNEKLGYKVSQLDTYSGAYTLNKVKEIYGLHKECHGSGNLPVYLVPEDNQIRMYEGIYAIGIEPLQQVQIIINLYH